MRLIDADALDVVGTVIPSGIDEKSYVMGMEYILNKIDSMPTIEERKTGRWERVDYGNGLYNYHCSQCRKIPRDNIMSDFCPNCGAKMEGNT